MRRHLSLQYILIFILAQVAWLSLLGLWIYWYVSNYIIYSKVIEKSSAQIISERTNIIALVGGLILMITVSVGMSLLFARLKSQIKITRFYDNFIANVTHELKSPLASIQLYLDTMNERRIPRSKQKEFLNQMMQDSSRLNDLINSILEISGLEQNKIMHRFKIVAAAPLIRSLVKEAGEQFKHQTKVIRMEGSADCQVVVDRNALKIVFNNIIDNAIKYSAQKAQLHVHFKRTFKDLVIDFTDRGIGISASEQKRIFDKFHRIYDANVPSVKGTGLGLYWAKEIIKNHGGRISVFSEGRDKGSMFRIELPIYRTSQKRYIHKLLKMTQKMQKRLESNEGENHA
jgi:two-component system phosphate regulon sensor histidine kinase PhoR